MKGKESTRGVRLTQKKQAEESEGSVGGWVEGEHILHRASGLKFYNNDVLDINKVDSETLGN